MVTGPSRQEPVRLVAVDEGVLAQLVRAATTDAHPDEVTPALDAGGSWSPARVAWLEAYHRDRRSGLDGPARESTWAVVQADQVRGAVRLRRTAPAELEAGIWLVRSARGHGLGRAALEQLVALARALDAQVLVARTTGTNAPAIAALRGLGFALSVGGDGAVRATRALTDGQPVSADLLG